jgi:hypothetical protein
MHRFIKWRVEVKDVNDIGALEFDRSGIWRLHPSVEVGLPDGYFLHDSNRSSGSAPRRFCVYGCSE